MVSAAPPEQKTLCHLFAVRRNLFDAGILYQCLFGVEMGCKMVGLQRLSPGSERADLPVGGCVLWAGRHGLKLLSHAPVHAAVP